jgi:hypothetical protein
VKSEDGDPLLMCCSLHYQSIELARELAQNCYHAICIFERLFRTTW